jgi:lon-related putative ATP-dependent protease
MSRFKPLPPEELYSACDLSTLGFETTDELQDLHSVIGQDRAVQAVEFAIGIQQDGYNLFALGPEGAGKFSLLNRYLKTAASERPTPCDWCYINNFAEPHKPRALALPPGRARTLAKDMDQLIDHLRRDIPAAFENDDYRSRKDALEDEFKAQNEKAFGDLHRRAEKEGVTLLKTPTGLVLAAAQDEQVMSPEAFKALPEAEQDERKQVLESYQDELEDLLQQVPRWQNELYARLRALDREVTRQAVDHLIEELAEGYRDQSGVLDFLEEVENSILTNTTDFLPKEGKTEEARSLKNNEGPFRQFRINVVVEQDPSATGAPVVFENNPTMGNLIGRIEHLSQYGSLVTDFNLIKPGAMHQANGGYLILEAKNLLSQPFAWEALKRALRANTLRIEAPGQSYAMISTVTLEPEPIPLDLKIFLTGDPSLYYMLSHYDPDFRELFKVAADFAGKMARTSENTALYAQLIATLARRKNLKPLDRSAVARIIEHSARLAEDTEKLSSHMGTLVDLAREADYLAGKIDHKVISAKDIQAAIDAKAYRSDRIRELIHEEILRGTIVIDSDGDKVGELNGLAVHQLDHFAFGRPSRISCRVRIGRGEVIDIERQADLGGRLHSKGVLIITSFLSARFGHTLPLSLSATLVFEQSYGEVEGDSASSAELYALLSALSGVALKQSLAVTGSVDQGGRVQAIGGVNEKIEGFFDVCSTRGLTGDQGVLIPKANVKHLMLRQDVVEAARQGKFHIYPVETIDQGIEILTGIPAGEIDQKGHYPIGSLNRLVVAKLNKFSRTVMALAKGVIRES